MGEEPVFRVDEDWVAAVNDHEMPVSSSVQVYIEASDQWFSGEEGIRTAISMGAPLQLYYDRSFESGAQVRVIVVKETA